MIDALLVRPLRGGAEPRFPVQLRRHRVLARRPIQTLGPDGAVGPNMTFERIADDPGVDDLNPAPQPVEGAALVAHLRSQVLLFGQPPHCPGLKDGLDQRFLAETVLAHLHRANGGDPVVMVRSRNRHRVNAVVHVLEHPPVIPVLLDFRKLVLKLPGLPGQPVPVHVADGHNVAAASRRVAAVFLALAADADAGDVDALIGPQHPPDIREREGRGAKRQGRAAQKLAAGEGGGAWFSAVCDVRLLHIRS